jgi:hypothetical protein
VAITKIESGNLINFNVGLAAAIPLIDPLAAQLNAVLALGLGPFQAALAAQLNAALAARVQLGLSLTGLDFIEKIAASVKALIALQASLAIAPVFPSVQIQTSLSASVALAASLQVQLGLINALIKASLAVQIPVVNLMGQLGAALSAGPVVFFLCEDHATLSAQGAAINAAFNNPNGLGGSTALFVDKIKPGENVFVACFVMKDPYVFTALQTIITIPSI